MRNILIKYAPPTWGRGWGDVKKSKESVKTE